jgi:hypothetical protein
MGFGAVADIFIDRVAMVVSNVWRCALRWKILPPIAHSGALGSGIKR